MTIPDMETRSLLEPPEFRSEAGGKITATGVAMRYGVKSQPIPGKARIFREQFKTGSLTKTLAEQEMRSHLEHHGPYLARTSNGTLRLADSPTELRYEIDLPDTTAGRDAAALLERQDLRGASIGFMAVPADTSWTVDTDGIALRSIGAARMRLVDLTVAPVYTDTTAALALRSLADERHMELRSLLEAADRGELPTLIASEPEDEEQEQRSEDGRDIPPPRERISSLMY